MAVLTVQSYCSDTVGRPETRIIYIWLAHCKMNDLFVN